MRAVEPELLAAGASWGTRGPSALSAGVRNTYDYLVGPDLSKLHRDDRAVCVARARHAVRLWEKLVSPMLHSRLTAAADVGAARLAGCRRRLPSSGTSDGVLVQLVQKRTISKLILIRHGQSIWYVPRTTGCRSAHARTDDLRPRATTSPRSHGPIHARPRPHSSAHDPLPPRPPPTPHHAMRHTCS